MHFAKLLVVFHDWLGVLEEVVDSGLHRFRIVIGSSTGLSALRAPFHHSFLWNFVVKDGMRFHNVRLEVGGLIDGAWEAINQVCLRWILDQALDEQFDS